MNNVFDIRRFRLLMIRHWSENRNKYLLSLGAVLALLLLWMGFLITLERGHALRTDMQLATYYVGLFLTGALFSSMLFGDLANKPKAINFMTVPASHLEKLACAFVYSAIIFFVCYTTLFYIADTLMVKVDNSLAYKHWQENQLYINGVREKFEPIQVVNVFFQKDAMPPQEPFNILLFILTIYLTVQGAYALGSIYFPAYSFIKTTISILLIILFFAFFIGKILEPMTVHGHFSNKFTSYVVNGNYGSPVVMEVPIPGWYRWFMIGPARYVLLVVFWVTAYFRLKEKEV